MKEYSAFLKDPVSLEPHHQIVLCHTGHSLGGSYPSAEVQSVYSAAPADWAIPRINVKTVSFKII